MGELTFDKDTENTRNKPHKADKVRIREHGGSGTGSLTAKVTTESYYRGHGATNYKDGAEPRPESEPPTVNN